MKINIKIGELAEYIEEYKGIVLKDNSEEDIRDLGCKINTPSGLTNINYIIKKENLEGIKITLENLIEVKCAKKHILRKNNEDTFAENLSVGDVIETINGDVKIKKIENIVDTAFYDIGIDSPHLYYDADGVLHHNTIITATLAKLCEKYGRTITIVPNKSLVEQTEEDFVNVGLDVGVYYGDRKELGRTHIISTWQSLNVLDKKSKNNLEEEIFTLADFLENVNAVIVDEAHGVAGDVLKTLLTKNLAKTPIRWGLTGTIPKDEISLMNLKVSIGEVVHEVKASDLQEQGVLSNCFINIIQTDEYKEFKTYQEELKFLVTNEERINYIGKLCSDIAEKGNTLILVDRIETGNKLLSLIKDSVFISGEVKTKERKNHYNEINFSDNKVIIATFGVAAVGINIVRINNLVLLEPGKSFIRVIQSIGRGLRKGFDKDFVNIYDVTASTKYAKKHLTERKKYYKTANYDFKIERVNFRN